MNKTILNKDSQRFLDVINERAAQVLQGHTLADLPIEKARVAFTQLVAPIPGKLKNIDVNIENRSVTYDEITVPVRVYKPANASGALPILVYFHGGGFVFGDPDFLDYTCRFLADGSHCMVVSVDYRRAPEHKFPAAHNDAYFVTKYIHDHAEEFNGNGIIAVGGDSAGGNLAASVCHMAKDSKAFNIVFQLLFYPWVELSNKTASDKKFKKGFYLELDTLNWMREQYLDKKADAKNPIANPQLQKDFRGLPPALVINGEDDMIHDEAKMYYEKLVAADVDAQFAEFGGVLHDFCALPSHYEAAFLAYDMACEELKKAFKSKI